MSRPPDPAWAYNARNREAAIAHMLTLGSCIINPHHVCPASVVKPTGCICLCHTDEEEDGWSLI